jgi:hypothetical protein
VLAANKAEDLKLPPPVFGPTTQFVSVDGRGIVHLADGSVWRVATHHHARARRWNKGAQVRVAASTRKSIWDHDLTNLDTGDVLAVIQATK